MMWETLRDNAIKAELKPTLNHKVFDEEKTIIMPIGDEHIGSRYYNADMHKRDLDWAYENNAHIILMGDELETATRDSVGSGVYEQDEIVDTQVEHFLHLYQPFANEGRILGIHPGNHELRVYKSTGLNLTKMMARQLDIPYFGFGKMHYFRVGNQGYSMYTTHGSSGSSKAYTKIKAILDIANMADAEIYAMGHVHQLTHHMRTFYKPDLRSKKVVESTKHFVIGGGYLNHWGSYGHMKNFEPVRQGHAKIHLSGLEHKVEVEL